jgi:histidyl-tRNA synthetase
VAPPQGKLKRVLETANKIGSSYALIVGDDEITAGAYALKDMKTGSQATVSRQELIDRFACQTR